MLKKIMMFLLATNVVASRPPKRRPTGTPHARANERYKQRKKNSKHFVHKPQKSPQNKKKCGVMFSGPASTLNYSNIK